MYSILNPELDAVLKRKGWHLPLNWPWADIELNVGPNTFHWQANLTHTKLAFSGMVSKVEHRWTYYEGMFTIQRKEKSSSLQPSRANRLDGIHIEIMSSLCPWWQWSYYIPSGNPLDLLVCGLGRIFSLQPFQRVR